MCLRGSSSASLSAPELILSVDQRPRCCVSRPQHRQSCFTPRPDARHPLSLQENTAFPPVLGSLSTCWKVTSAVVLALGILFLILPGFELMLAHVGPRLTLCSSERELRLTPRGRSSGVFLCTVRCCVLCDDFKILTCSSIHLVFCNLDHHVEPGSKKNHCLDRCYFSQALQQHRQTILEEPDAMSY